MHGQQTCYTSTLVCFLAVLYLDDIFHTMFAAGFEISRASICQFASFYPSVNPSILPSFHPAEAAVPSARHIA